MDSPTTPERNVPIQYVRSSRAFRQFKNPPQPHMCIQDTVKETSEKLYINVLGWQKIANPKQYSDPIPLYGGMPVPQGCAPNINKPPLLVFAVMVNPDILKANGKNSVNLNDRDDLVSLLCDFVEAMNPGLKLTRNPVILKDRDLAGELKDVWLAVQNKREREKGQNQDIMYKVYDIDGIGSEDPINDEDKSNSQRNVDGYNTSPTRQHSEKKAVKSSKQILMNAGQKSEFDSGMNNCQLNKTQDRFGNSSDDTTYCTSVYGQIVSSRENHNQINDLQHKFANTETKPSSSFRKESSPSQDKKVEGFDEFSKRSISKLKPSDSNVKKQKCLKNNKSNSLTNGKNHYNFFPVFDNKSEDTDDSLVSSDTNSKMTDCAKDEIRNDNSKMIIDPMQKLVLHTTENGICDNTSLNSISS